MELIKTNVGKYVKDKRTNAIINNDEQQLLSTISQRQKSKQFTEMQKQIDKMARDIEDLKSAIGRGQE